MGWRGALRSIAAAQRRNERTVEKRRRELLANQKQFNKLTEQALAAYEAETHENLIEVLRSILSIELRAS